MCLLLILGISFLNIWWGKWKLCFLTHKFSSKILSSIVSLAQTYPTHPLRFFTIAYCHRHIKESGNWVWKNSSKFGAHKYMMYFPIKGKKYKFWFWIRVSFLKPKSCSWHQNDYLLPPIYLLLLHMRSNLLTYLHHTLHSYWLGYTALQTHPCNENRVPCNENRFFPVRISSQGKPCFHYRGGFTVYLNMHLWMFHIIK